MATKDKIIRGITWAVPVGAATFFLWYFSTHAHQEIAPPENSVVKVITDASQDGSVGHPIPYRDGDWAFQVRDGKYYCIQGHTYLQVPHSNLVPVFATYSNQPDEPKACN